jgi:hypothetical protein
MSDKIGGIMQVAAAATPIVMGAFAKKDANNRATEAAKEANALGKQLASLEANRQDITNPYANLSVSTEAAEMQAQQTDQALANTLDTMRSGGFGAAGATALARQAAASKQGISADIKQQEATNEKYRAMGEQQAFAVREQREMDKLDRVANLQEGYQQREMDALAGKQAINQQTAGAVGGVLGEIAKDPSQIQALFSGGSGNKEDEVITEEVVGENNTGSSGGSTSGSSFNNTGGGSGIGSTFDSSDPTGIGSDPFFN